MEIAITKMSSKGQVVIPREMRKDIHEGEKIMIIKEGKQLILKRAEDLEENLKEDLAFAKKTEEALTNIKAGKGIKMDFDNFIEEMKKW
jgi:AbrB family looped-hinge helix DNA binding protein